jgi:hypothetical protein
MQDTKELQSFDVFSRKTGSWKFLCAVDAYTPTQAKEKAMREHQITNWTGVSVYPTK